MTSLAQLSLVVLVSQANGNVLLDFCRQEFTEFTFGCSNWCLCQSLPDSRDKMSGEKIRRNEFGSLLGTSASLLVTSALLVVTRSY